MSATTALSSDNDAGAIPEPGDPDRKRVLNILAQRRYRKRRRDRLAALEAQSKKASTIGSLPSPPDSEESPKEADSLQTMVTTTSDIISFGPVASNLPPFEADFEPFTCQDFQNDLDLSMYTNVSNSHQTSSLFPQAPDAFDMFPSSNVPSLAFPTVDSNYTMPAITSAFMDDAHLQIPVMSTLRACIRLCELLDCMHTVLHPTALRVLAPFPPGSIPSHLQPTQAQQLVPHHPLIDILPWPSTRSKLVCAFAVKQMEVVKDPQMAIMNLMADIDHDIEGIRVHGSDPLDGNNWEVGEAFFRNWWWVLDGKIVERSNALRAQRGAGRLKLTDD